jgi:hypothetical protein
VYTINSQEIERLDQLEAKCNEPSIDHNVNSKEAEIFISDKDRPDQFKATRARVNAEREIEYSRILNNGIRLGFIEEEPLIEAKL